MPDIDDLEPEDLSDYAASAEVGKKVIEMADRVKVMHALVPGAVAKWGFEIDGTAFDVAVTVRQE